jgi:aspartyl aminopeptidase
MSGIVHLHCFQVGRCSCGLNPACCTLLPLQASAAASNGKGNSSGSGGSAATSGGSAAAAPPTNGTTAAAAAPCNVVDNHHALLLDMLADQLGCLPTDIVDFELNMCDVQPGVLGGAQEEFVFVGRLDNLASCYTALEVSAA